MRENETDERAEEFKARVVKVLNEKFSGKEFESLLKDVQANRYFQVDVYELVHSLILQSDLSKLALWELLKHYQYPNQIRALPKYYDKKSYQHVTSKEIAYHWELEKLNQVSACLVLLPTTIRSLVNSKEDIRGREIEASEEKMRNSLKG